MCQGVCKYCVGSVRGRMVRAWPCSGSVCSKSYRSLRAIMLGSYVSAFDSGFRVKGWNPRFFFLLFGLFCCWVA